MHYIYVRRWHLQQVIHGAFHRTYLAHDCKTPAFALRPMGVGLSLPTWKYFHDTISYIAGLGPIFGVSSRQEFGVSTQFWWNCVGTLPAAVQLCSGGESLPEHHFII